MSTLTRVVLESPYAASSQGTVEEHTTYAQRAMHDSLMRGEAPLASHLLYTQVLDDQSPAERHLGISAGHAWVRYAEVLVVYVDYGISPGMMKAIELAWDMNIPTEQRTIGRNP